MADNNPPPRKCTSKRKHIDPGGQPSSPDSKKKKPRDKGPAKPGAPKKKKASGPPRKGPDRSRRKQILGDNESGKVLAAIETYLSSKDKTEERSWDEASCSWHLVRSFSGGEEESAQIGRKLRDVTPFCTPYDPATASPLGILKHILTQKASTRVRLLKPTNGSDISDTEEDDPVWHETPNLRKTVAGVVAQHMPWEDDPTQNNDPRFMRMMRYLSSVELSRTVHLQLPVCAQLLREASENSWGPEALSAMLLHMSQVRNSFTARLMCVALQALYPACCPFLGITSGQERLRPTQSGRIGMRKSRIYDVTVIVQSSGVKRGTSLTNWLLFLGGSSV